MDFLITSDAKTLTLVGIPERVGGAFLALVGFMVEVAVPWASWDTFSALLIEILAFVAYWDAGLSLLLESVPADTLVLPSFIVAVGWASWLICLMFIYSLFRVFGGFDGFIGVLRFVGLGAVFVFFVRINALSMSIFNVAMFADTLLPLRFVVTVSGTYSTTAVDSVESGIALTLVALSDFIWRACQKTFAVNFLESSQTDAFMPIGLPK